MAHKKAAKGTIGGTMPKRQSKGPSGEDRRVMRVIDAAETEDAPRDVAAPLSLRARLTPRQTLGRAVKRQSRAAG
jgi:hypothetical protein